MGSGTSLEYCELSHVGRRRANNQDAMAVLDAVSPEQYRRRGYLLLVADGMGAHAAGEQASQLAAREVPRAYEKQALRSPPLALRASFIRANEEIHARGESSAELRGMGTTCTALVILPRGALVGHVGDSRAYRVRGTTIEQLSRDHSLAWEVEARQLEAGAEALPAPPKNIITRSMGPHERLDVDLEGPFAVAAGDIFVLCSDGLSGQVADEELGCFAAALPLADAAAAMLGLALVRGGPDNITLIVARAGSQEVTDPAATNTPWPRVDEEAPRQTEPTLPLLPLVVAGSGLLGALLFNPESALMKPDGLVGRLIGGELARAVAWALSGVMGLLAISGLASAAVTGLASGDRRTQSRPASEPLGKGPYRSADCTPSASLIEGIVASVETAADGLEDRERHRAIDQVAAARRAIAAQQFSAAVAAAARGIAVYKESVDAASRGDTTPGSNA